MGKIVKKFLSFILVFLLIFSMGNGVLRPIAENNSPNTSLDNSNSTSANTTEKNDTNLESDNSNSSDNSSNSNMQVIYDEKNNLQKSSAEERIYLNEHNFPDIVFLQYLKDHTKYTGNTTDGYYTKAQANEVTKINVPKGTYSHPIYELTGINYFENLEGLYCQGNELTSLDLSKNTKLEWLECQNNKLTSLDLSKNTELRALEINNNHITNLDLSNCPNLNGTSFYEGLNQTQTALCDRHFGKLTVNLTGLVGNSIGNKNNVTIEGDDWDYDSYLGVATYKGKGRGNPKELKYKYDLNFNRKSLNVSLNLGYLINSITFPDPNFETYLINQTYTYTNDGINYYYTPEQLEKMQSISCSDENIKDLSGIELFKNLIYCECSYNKLTSLNVNGATSLESLYCQNNELTDLDLSNNTNLNWFNGSNQNPSKTYNCYKQVEGASTKFAVDMTEVFDNPDKLKNVVINDNNWSYDSNTGIATYIGSGVPSNLNYKYNTGMKNFQLEVNLKLNTIDTSNINGLIIYYINFPDANFRNYLLKNTGYSTNEDDVKYYTSSQLANMTSISCAQNQITSLKGIEHFTALQTLGCDQNLLTSLDTSGLNLNDFNGGNQTANAACYFDATDNKYKVNMAIVVGNENVGNVINNLGSGWNYDNTTGIATYTGNRAPSYFSYNYQTDSNPNHQLSVKLNLTEGQKQFNVEFNSDGGSKVPNQVIIANEKATKPDDPTKDGYKFAGWYNGDEVFDFGTPITSNITLTAHWTEIPPTQYTVTFDSNGGSEVPSVQVNDGEKVKRPDDPTKDGYKFAGWYNGDEVFDFDTPITSNITLTAHWGIPIDFKHFPDENFRNYLLTTFDHKIPTTGDPYFTQEQIEAIKDIDCSNKDISDLTGIKYFTNLEKLNCSNNKLTKLDVRYYCTKLLELNCSNNELTFLGVTGSNNITKFDCSNNHLIFLDTTGLDNIKDEDFKASGQTSKAVCEYDGTNYIVDMYNLMGAENAGNVNLTEGWHWAEFFGCEKAIHDGNIAPAKLNYTYETKKNEHHLLEVELTLNYTVRFLQNDGVTQAAGSMTVDAGTTITLPANPEVPDGQIFEGFWYKDKNCNYKDRVGVAGESYKVEGNIDLYAGSGYTVSFDANGGLPKPDPQLVAKDHKSTRPTNPTKDGCEFAGWYNGNELFNFDTPITSNIKLTAHWNKIIEPGVYKIKSAIDQNYVLDVAGASTENGANVQIYGNNNTLAQRFKIEKVGEYYKITDMCSGKVLDVAGAGKDPCTNLQQYEGNSTDAQLWSIETADDGSYKFKSKCNDLYINISAGAAQDGQNVWLYPEDNTKANKFVLEKDSDTLNLNNQPYTFLSKLAEVDPHNLKVLDISCGSLENSANLQLWDSNGTDAQKFIIQYIGAGYYTVTNVNSAKVLDVAGAGNVNGTNVAQYSLNYTAAQMWNIAQNGDGSITLKPMCAPGKCLDINGAGTDNGTNAQIYDSNGTNAQKFVLLQNAN